MGKDGNKPSRRGSIGRLTDLTIDPENQRLVKKRRENMYELYFNLLKYSCIMYVIVFVVSVLNTFVNWLVLSDEILANYFYGFNTSTQKYLSLLYLPDFNIKSQTQALVSQVFFLFYNVMVYGAFMLLFINLEKDLELVYIDPNNSEISLFSLYFEHVPRDKYEDFERLIVRHLEANRSRDCLLNVSHVFDLRTYFHYVKNSKNHYFFKGFYQNWEGKKGTLLNDNRSRLTFRKGSFVPRPEQAALATPEDIKVQRRVRLISEEEQKIEELKLEKLRKAKMKEIHERIKAEENFFFQIHRIQTKIKERQKSLYLGRTFISFKSLDVCVAFLRMFQSHLQKEVLADANKPEYDYLLKITAKIAPFIDDLRWEHMYIYRHYYLLEISFVLMVSAINIVLERMYNQNNLREMILFKKGLSDLTWLWPLLILLVMQVLLSVISVVCLEKMISRYTFYKRSKKIEINFVFFNFFMILNNIMVVFYGFLWAASDLAKDVTEDKKYYFNFYINFQWIKNSLIIIFIPLLQRLVGDLLIKSFLIPFFAARCCKKKKVEELPKPSSTNQSMIEKKSQEIVLNEEPRNSDNLLGEIAKKVEEEENNDQPSFDSQADSEEEEKALEDEGDEENKSKRKKPVHDFGLNSSYLIQVAFFTGFYLSFCSPLLLLITMLGVIINYYMEDLLLRNFYEKTHYISISNLFITLRWSFVAFCIGIVISVQNSKIYLYIVNTKSNELSQISEISGFQNMIGYCNFVISLIFFFQMSTGKIMFRVLHSIDTLKRKFGGAFFKYDFEKVNYLSQNPFYSF